LLATAARPAPDEVSSHPPPVELNQARLGGGGKGGEGRPSKKKKEKEKE